MFAGYSSIRAIKNITANAPIIGSLDVYTFDSDYFFVISLKSYSAAASNTAGNITSLDLSSKQQTFFVHFTFSGGGTFGPLYGRVKAGEILKVSALNVVFDLYLFSTNDDL